MTTAKKLMTANELLTLPDNGTRRELIRGELFEMPPASDDHGFVGDEFTWQIGSFVRQRKLGRGRIAETGFQLTEHTVLAPDYAFISYERMSNRPQARGYAQVAPDLVMEVFSPNDRQPTFDRKIGLWLSAGVRAVLAVYPGRQEVHAHYDDGTVQRFGIDDTFTCESVLPGFSCPVADIFTY
jgi:Uma2 family endonuclease